MVDTRQVTGNRHVKEEFWPEEAHKCRATYHHINVNEFASFTRGGELKKKNLFKHRVWYIAEALAKGQHVLVVDEHANDSAILLCGLLLCAGGISKHLAHLHRLRAHISPIGDRAGMVSYDRWVQEKAGEIRSMFLNLGVTFATKATLTWDEAVLAVVEKVAEDNRQFAGIRRRPG